MMNFPLSDYPKKDTIVENTVAAYDQDELVDKATAEKLGNRYDRRDMHRMGKIQELRVRVVILSLLP
jgi:hypothetical protein